METQFKALSQDVEKINEICYNLESKYNISVDLGSDIIMMRRKIDEFSNFIVFAILSEIRPEQIKRFFTEAEIEMYTGAKMETKELKFPIVFDAIEIAEDQWITKTTLQQLILFRDAGLTNYNPNTQRAMKKFGKKGTEYYKVSINYRQVGEIADSMENHNYIPDTITLNIPYDSNADFDYKNGKLIIRALDHFDATDGYHRICAMSRLNSENPDFDYPMELRITNYSEAKAQQFIFQMDQKTKMTKTETDSFDQSSAANMTVNKLNKEISSSLRNKIGREKEPINATILSGIINYLYVVDVKIINPRDYSTKLYLDLNNKFSYLLMSRQELMQKEWSREEILAALFAFKKTENDIDIPQKYDEYKEHLDELSSKGKLNRLINPGMRRVYYRLEEELDLATEASE